MKHEDFIVKVLGKGTVKSPIKISSKHGESIYDFIKDSDRIVYNATLNNFIQCRELNDVPISFEKAFANFFFLNQLRLRLLL